MGKVRQRTLMKIAAKKWTQFVSVPVTDELKAQHAFLEHCIEIRSNSRFECHLFACESAIGGVVQCNVRRHGDIAPITYDDLMMVKTAVFGPEVTAVEVYPPPGLEWGKNLPVRVLWILPATWSVPFGLHLPTAWGRKAQ